LYNHLTLGLAWLCLFMAVALWSAIPARRHVILWTFAMFVGALAAFSGVFASFVNITNLAQVIGYTADDVAGRYLLPVLLAWFATMMIVFFAELSSSTSSFSSPVAKPSLTHQPQPGLAPAGRHRKNKAAGSGA
jgi:glucan phosphoethanolaminetransferase (alkaline phosphatase superfamily)